MKNIFNEHPESVGESYLQHLKFATVFGLKMMAGGLACFIHAIFPFIFKNTGSNMLIALMKNFVQRMPSIEPRVEEIGVLIEKKKNKNSI